MSNLRLRVELSKGRVGIPLGKLGQITKETLAFLTSVGKDVGFDNDPKDWLALNFENNSVDFDCMKISKIDQEVIDKTNRVFRSVMNHDFSDPEINLLIKPATRFQYARIANPIDIDEKIIFGLYKNGEKNPEDWFELTKESANRVVEGTPQFVSYHGEIQGIIHAFYKESDRPKLVVRELSTRNLVDCFFKPKMYSAAVETLIEPDAVVFVEGEVSEDRAKGLVESIKVTDFRPAPDFDENLFENFIGSKPDYTGKMTTEEFIEEIREDG